MEHINRVMQNQDLSQIRAPVEARLSSDDITPMFLEFFECAVNPEYFSVLATKLEYWLAQDLAPSSLSEFEAYSASLWESLAKADMDTRFGDSTKRPALSIDLHMRSKEGRIGDELLLDQFFVDDQKRLREWIKSGDICGQERIFRVHRTDVGVDYLLGKGDHERIDFFKISNEMNALVKRLISESFAISHAELQALELLLRGLTIQEIASKTGKSVETIRSQVKSISVKMGAPRQQDIISLVNNIQAQIKPETQDQGDCTSEQKELTLRDGRRLFYRVYGPENGRPVLCMHNFASASHLPPIRRDVLLRHNLKWIVPARAGYGQSALNPKEGLPLVLDHIEDYREVMLAENAQKPVIIAVGSAAAIGYIFARMYPNLVKKTLLLDILPPVTSRETALAYHSGMYRAGALASLYSPGVLRLLTRLVIRRASRVKSASELREMGGQDGDESCGEAEGFHEYVEPNLKELFAGKGEGAWRDCTYLALDWDTPLEEAKGRPELLVMHHYDFPFVDKDYVKGFCKNIGAQYFQIPRPYRCLHQQMGRLSSQIARI